MAIFDNEKIAGKQQWVQYRGNSNESNNLYNELARNFNVLTQSLEDINSAISRSRTTGLGKARNIPNSKKIKSCIKSFEDLSVIGGTLRKDIDNIDQTFYDATYKVAQNLANLDPDREFYAYNTLGIGNLDNINDENNYLRNADNMINLRLSNFMMDFSLEDGVDSSRYTVDSFASMFKEYYDNQIAVGNISPDASYSDFVKLMLPQSYTIEKDLRWWEKFGKEVLYGLGVGQLISLIIGVDLITGAQLSSAQVEKYGKDVAGRVASLLLTYGMSTALEGTAVVGRRLVQVLASSLTYYSVQGVGSAAEWPQWVTTSLALTASLLVAFGMEGWVKNGFKTKVYSDSNYVIIERKSAEQVNAEYLKKNPGFEPPFKPGTDVYTIVTTDEKFVRVYSEEKFKVGGWMMKESDIIGLSPNQIQDKFALPSTPKYMTDVILPKGCTVQVGVANGILGQSGGGEQYYLMGQYIGEFINERILR